jgi:hypothetical protein
MTKKNIRYINWETDQVVDGNQFWVLPQVIAGIGSSWPLVKDVNGRVSFKSTISAWGVASDRLELVLDGETISKRGITNLLKWLCLSPRGSVLGSGAKQTAKEWIRYSAGVPLVLSAFKEYREVPYGAWDWNDPLRSFLVDEDILAWSNHFGLVQGWTDAELLDFREGSLTVKTGKTQGTVRKPTSMTQVYGVTDPAFKALPRLMKLNLCQLWCFHPTLRTRYTIGSHMDLDRQPTPLVEGDVLELPVSPTTTSMWDMV